MEGLYESVIKLNFIDKKNGEFMTFLRRHINVNDKNMFVTNFILYCLFESIDLGTISYDATSVSQAINGLLQFRDKNKDEGIPIYNFWSQRYENNTWTSYPQVLYDILKVYIDLPNFIKDIIEWTTGNYYMKLVLLSKKK